MHKITAAPALLLALALSVVIPAAAFADEPVTPPETTAQAPAHSETAPTENASAEPSTPVDETGGPETGGPETEPSEPADQPSDVPSQPAESDPTERRRTATSTGYDDTVLTDIYVTNRTFYPRVRDNYRESAWVGFSYDSYDPDAGYHVGSLAWEVRSVDQGWIVKRGTDDVWCGCTIGWNGTNTHGDVVRPGAYVITVTAYDAEGLVWDSFSRTVTVATKLVTRTRTAHRTGDEFVSKSTRGACYVTRSTYDGEATLDCWGGRYAQVVYSVWVPGNATVVDQWVRGYNGCCDSGRVTKTFDRVSDHRVRGVVRATDWRNYTVERVNVRYSYRVRI